MLGGSSGTVERPRSLGALRDVQPGLGLGPLLLQSAQQRQHEVEACKFHVAAAGKEGQAQRGGEGSTHKLAVGQVGA